LVGIISQYPLSRPGVKRVLNKNFFSAQRPPLSAAPTASPLASRDFLVLLGAFASPKTRLKYSGEKGFSFPYLVGSHKRATAFRQRLHPIVFARHTAIPAIDPRQLQFIALMSQPTSAKPNPSKSPSPEAKKPEPRWLKAVQEYARGMGSGVINVVVHDGRVTQVERTERTRFDREPQDYEI
jgi:hypothetical protein